MIIFFNSLPWFFSGITFLLLANRIWRYYKAKRGIVAKAFFLSMLSIALALLLPPIFSLFTNYLDPSIWRWIITTSIFLTLTGVAFFGYLISYLKFPRFPPETGFLTVFILAIIETLLMVIFPANPTIKEGWILWNLHPIPGFVFFALVSIGAIPMGIALVKNALSFPGFEERIKTLSLGVLCALASVVAFSYFLEFEPFRSCFITIWSIAIFFVILSTKPTFFT